MEAKDTVMNDAQAVASVDTLNEDNLFEYWIGDRPLWKIIAEAQAEISFKAGKDQSLNELLAYAQSGELDKRFAEIRQAGRKEVVDYLGLIKTIGLEDDGYVSHTFVALKEEWQAKLKEWGL